MQTRNKVFDDISQLMTNAMGVAQGARDEAETAMKSMIDRWLAEEVLCLAFQNGHRKGNFRGIPFSQLRELGLPSLRHRRRLLCHGQLESPFFQLRNERIVEQERRRRLSGRKAFSPGLEAVAK